MSVVCTSVSVALGVRRAADLPTRLASHAERCPGCSVEVEMARLLDAELTRLADVTEAAPAETPQRILASLGPVPVDQAPRRHGALLPVAAAAAIATATAAAAAGTAVALRFYRHRAA